MEEEGEEGVPSIIPLQEAGELSLCVHGKRKTADLFAIANIGNSLWSERGLSHWNVGCDLRVDLRGTRHIFREPPDGRCTSLAAVISISTVTRVGYSLLCLQGTYMLRPSGMN